MTPLPQPPVHVRKALRRLPRRPAPSQVGPLAVAPEMIVAGRSRPRRRTYAAAAASGMLLMGSPNAGAFVIVADGAGTGAPPSSLARSEPGSGDAGSLPVLVTQQLRGSPAAAAGDDDASEGEARTGPIPLAVIDDVEVVVPDGEPVVVGFHEAGGPSPRPLTPTTDLDVDLGVGHVHVAEDADEARYATMVLPTRSRGTHPASAVDVALAPGSVVTAPVTGEVLLVAQYALYGDHLDWIIRIRPDSDPTKVVELVHVVEPTIHAGERVEAGVSTIAKGVRPLPFASQIDEFAFAEIGVAVPHVHIEVEQA